MQSPEVELSGSFVIGLLLALADIAKTYEEWSAKGAEFLTPPKDHGAEHRAYVRDPDGHLIEVGQATGIVAAG